MTDAAAAVLTITVILISAIVIASVSGCRMGLVVCKMVAAAVVTTATSRMGCHMGTLVVASASSWQHSRVGMMSTAGAMVKLLQGLILQLQARAGSLLS
jgi:hypothetical protein